jgi:hypothetical protein
MLSIDYSSTFNTIDPAKLITKLGILGLNPYLWNWILDFLTGCTQVVRVGSNTSGTLNLTTGAPQRCVLRPLSTLCSSTTAWPCTTPAPSSKFVRA